MKRAHLHVLPVLQRHILHITRAHARDWTPARTDVADLQQRMRAQSLLAGWLVYRDGSANPGVLTLAQAIDVLNWSEARA